MKIELERKEVEAAIEMYIKEVYLGSYNNYSFGDVQFKDQFGGFVDRESEVGISVDCYKIDNKPTHQPAPPAPPAYPSR